MFSSGQTPGSMFHARPGKIGWVSVAATAQVAAVLVFLFVAVMSVGYYFLFKTGRDTLREMRAQRTAVGRPQVIVDDDYDRLPEVNVVVRNVS